MQNTGRHGGAARPGRIIIVRHGRPALDREAGPRLDWRAYRDWWAKYEGGSLAQGQAPPGELARQAENAMVFSSMRPRATETAAMLSPGRKVTSDPVFNEAPLPPPQWSPRRRYLPKTWNKIARLAWLLGHDGGEEPATQTRRRAEAAADLLIEAACGGCDVVLAAHGWFNRMLRSPLVRRGWKCVRDGGDAYWSWRIYERRK
ncbi:MAG: histidine phosphatase family protein [Alphaproteobacteria bacterium]|nr:histidine phosphatase family protein [Alphaproteobacteria bacterium]